MGSFSLLMLQVQKLFRTSGFHGAAQKAHMLYVRRIYISEQPNPQGILFLLIQFYSLGDCTWSNGILDCGCDPGRCPNEDCISDSNFSIEPSWLRFYSLSGVFDSLNMHISPGISLSVCLKHSCLTIWVLFVLSSSSSRNSPPHAEVCNVFVRYHHTTLFSDWSLPLHISKVRQIFWHSLHKIALCRMQILNYLFNKTCCKSTLGKFHAVKNSFLHELERTSFFAGPFASPFSEFAHNTKSSRAPSPRPIGKNAIFFRLFIHLNFQFQLLSWDKSLSRSFLP